MTKLPDFELEFDAVKAFDLRGDLLRPDFGHWDACDPVCHCILDLVEAQSEIADAITDYVDSGGSRAAIKAAVEKRQAAADRLMTALNDRDSWPEALR